MRAETILGLPLRRGRWNMVVVIHPEQAKAILEAQPAQRPVSQNVVDRYAAQIRSGQFVRTHQGVAFDEAGLLFDGQHRLWACFMASTAIEVMCCFNEPRGNFDLIDDGAPRTDAQKAVIKGHFSGSTTANTGVAAGRFIWAYDNGKNPVHAYLEKGWHSRIFDDVLARHPGLPAMVTRMDTDHRRKLRLPASLMVALFTLFDEADDARAAIFLHQVFSGEGLRRGDPALTLRDSALAGKALMRGARTEFAYRIVRAWNAFYEGRTLGKLYGSTAPGATPARPGGLDPFPEIAGYRRRA